jgi:hypothetical protein
VLEAGDLAAQLGPGQTLVAVELDWNGFDGAALEQLRHDGPSWEADGRHILNGDPGRRGTDCRGG